MTEILIIIGSYMLGNVSPEIENLDFNQNTLILILIIIIEGLLLYIFYLKKRKNIRKLNLLEEDSFKRKKKSKIRPKTKKRWNIWDKIKNKLKYISIFIVISSITLFVYNYFKDKNDYPNETAQYFAVDRDKEEKADDKKTNKKKKKLYGYKDLNNEVVIEAKFEGARRFRGGSAEVLFKGKYGIIDKKGNYILPPKYDKIYRFYRNEYLVEKGSLKYLFDPKEKLKIILRKSKIYEIFFNGAYVIEKDGKFGLIDTRKNITEVIYDKISRISRYAFNLYLLEKDDKLALYKMKDGITQRTDLIYNYIKTSPNKNFIFAGNEKGKFLISVDDFKRLTPYYENIEIMGDIIIAQKNSKKYILDKDDGGLIDIPFEKIQEFGTDYKIFRDQKEGLIREKDQRILEPIYNKIKYSEQNIAIVENNNYYRVFNYNDSNVSDTKYGNIYRLGMLDATYSIKTEKTLERYFIIVKNYKKGLMDERGKVLVEPKYNNISINQNEDDFDINFDDEVYMTLDTSGKIIRPVLDKTIDEISEGLGVYSVEKKIEN